MRVFRNREDRVPVLLVTAFFLIDLWAYFYFHHPLALAAWMLLALMPKLHICAWNHHHQHVSTFRPPWLNRVLELVYALQTGITSGTWVLHHSIGHHQNYLDQSKDESRWQAADGSVMSELRYTLEVGATAYFRAYTVGKEHPRQQRQFLIMGLVTLLVLAGLIAFKPAAGLILYGAPMVFGLFFTAWATYSHHAGKSTASHFVATNNILHGGYNLLTGNLGYHTAHHYRPGVHWSKLPELHAQIADQIPDDCYLTPGFPWTLGQKPVVPGQTAAPSLPAESSPALEPIVVPAPAAVR